MSLFTYAIDQHDKSRALCLSNNGLPSSSFGPILKSLLPVPSSRAFVLEPNGRVVFSSHSTAITFRNYSSGTQIDDGCFLSADRITLACQRNISDDAGYELLRLLLAKEPKAKTVNAMKMIQTTVVDGSDEEYVVSRVPIQTYSAVFTLALFTPINYFLSDIRRATVVVIVVCVVMILFGAVITYLLLRFVSKRIEDLAEQMYKDPFAKTGSASSKRRMKTSSQSSSSSSFVSSSSGSTPLQGTNTVLSKKLSQRRKQREEKADAEREHNLGFGFSENHDDHDDNDVNNTMNNNGNDKSGIVDPVTDGGADESQSSSVRSSANSSLFGSWSNSDLLTLFELAQLEDAFTNFREIIEQLRSFMPASLLDSPLDQQQHSSGTSSEPTRSHGDNLNGSDSVCGSSSTGTDGGKNNNHKQRLTKSDPNPDSSSSSSTISPTTLQQSTAAANNNNINNDDQNEDENKILKFASLGENSATNKLINNNNNQQNTNSSGIPIIQASQLEAFQQKKRMERMQGLSAEMSKSSDMAPVVLTTTSNASLGTHGSTADNSYPSFPIVTAKRPTTTTTTRTNHRHVDVSQEAEEDNNESKKNQNSMMIMMSSDQQQGKPIDHDQHHSNSQVPRRKIVKVVSASAPTSSFTNHESNESAQDEPDIAGSNSDDNEDDSRATHDSPSYHGGAAPTNGLSSSPKHGSQLQNAAGLKSALKNTLTTMSSVSLVGAGPVNLNHHQQYQPQNSSQCIGSSGGGEFNAMMTATGTMTNGNLTSSLNNNYTNSHHQNQNQNALFANSSYAYYKKSVAFFGDVEVTTTAGKKVTQKLNVKAVRDHAKFLGENHPLNEESESLSRSRDEEQENGDSSSNSPKLKTSTDTLRPSADNDDDAEDDIVMAESFGQPEEKKHQEKLARDKASAATHRCLFAVISVAGTVESAAIGANDDDTATFASIISTSATSRRAARRNNRSNAAASSTPSATTDESAEDSNISSSNNNSDSEHVNQNHQNSSGGVKRRRKKRKSRVQKQQQHGLSDPNSARTGSENEKMIGDDFNDGNNNNNINIDQQRRSSNTSQKQLYQQQRLLDRSRLIAEVINNEVIESSGGTLIEYRNDTFFVVLRISKRETQSRAAFRFVCKLIEASSRLADHMLQRSFNQREGKRERAIAVFAGVSVGDVRLLTLPAVMGDTVARPVTVLGPCVKEAYDVMNRMKYFAAGSSPFHPLTHAIGYLVNGQTHETLTITSFTSKKFNPGPPTKYRSNSGSSFSFATTSSGGTPKNRSSRGGSSVNMNEDAHRQNQENEDEEEDCNDFNHNNNYIDSTAQELQSSSSGSGSGSDDSRRSFALRYPQIARVSGPEPIFATRAGVVKGNRGKVKHVMRLSAPSPFPPE